MREYENSLLHGYSFVVDDEAGREPLAGPVVSAAVILPKDFLILHINDSKIIPKKGRALYKNQGSRPDIGIGSSIPIIDRNIYHNQDELAGYTIKAGYPIWML